MVTINKKLMKFFVGDIPDKKQIPKAKSAKEAAPGKTADHGHSPTPAAPTVPASRHKLANRIFALLMLGVICLGLFFGQKLLSKRESDKAAQRRNQIMDQVDQKRKNANLEKQLQQNKQRQQGQHHQGQNGGHMGSHHNGAGQSGQMPGMRSPMRQNQQPQGGMAPGPKVKAQTPPMIQPNKRQ